MKVEPHYIPIDAGKMREFPMNFWGQPLGAIFGECGDGGPGQIVDPGPGISPPWGSADKLRLETVGQHGLLEN